MNTYRTIITSAFVAAVVAVVVPNLAAQGLEQKIEVTFSAPVEVPGVVLPTGTYIFEALEAGRLTRIVSADGLHVFATLLTVPEEPMGSEEKSLVTLDSNPQGGPEQVHAWFPSYGAEGSEFVYPKPHAHTKPQSVSITGALLKEDGHLVKHAAKAVGESSEYVAVHAEHAVVGSGVAIAHAGKTLFL